MMCPKGGSKEASDGLASLTDTPLLVCVGFPPGRPRGPCIEPVDWTAVRRDPGELTDTPLGKTTLRR